MSRKPVHFELAGGKSQRQKIWELILKQGMDFTQADVTPGGVPNDTARDYLRGLTKAGYLKQTQEGKAPRIKATWKRLKESGAEAPRVNKNGAEVTQGQGNEAIWGAMQALASFTPRVLAKMSGVSEQTVKTYCKMLERAGYLTVERESVKGMQATYRLMRSRINGPRPPMITRLKAVYDPNIHEIVWQQDEDDALEEMEAA